jgi:CRP/FNR family transcriptional regulator, cyclic AMP receptor protein
MDIAFFRTHSLTKGLNHAELEKLNSALREQRFAQGDKICTEGTLAEGLFLLRAGSVRVVKKTASGGEHLLAHLDAPTVLGELELVSGDSSAATVIAASPVVAYVLSRDQFESLVDHGDAVVSKLMRNIARVVVHRLTETNKRMVEMLSPSELEKFQAVQKDVGTNWS